MSTLMANPSNLQNGRSLLSGVFGCQGESSSMESCSRKVPLPSIGVRTPSWSTTSMPPAFSGLYQNSSAANPPIGSPDYLRGLGGFSGGNVSFEPVTTTPFAQQQGADSTNHTANAFRPQAIPLGSPSLSFGNQADSCCNGVDIGSSSAFPTFPAANDLPQTSLNYSTSSGMGSHCSSQTHLQMSPSGDNNHVSNVMIPLSGGSGMANSDNNCSGITNAALDAQCIVTSNNVQHNLPHHRHLGSQPPSLFDCTTTGFPNSLTNDMQPTSSNISDSFASSMLPKREVPPRSVQSRQLGQQYFTPSAGSDQLNANGLMQNMVGCTASQPGNACSAAQGNAFSWQPADTSSTASTNTRTQNCLSTNSRSNFGGVARLNDIVGSAMNFNTAIHGTATSTEKTWSRNNAVSNIDTAVGNDAVVDNSTSTNAVTNDRAPISSLFAGSARTSVNVPENGMCGHALNAISNVRLSNPNALKAEPSDDRSDVNMHDPKVDHKQNANAAMVPCTVGAQGVSKINESKRGYSNLFSNPNAQRISNISIADVDAQSSKASNLEISNSPLSPDGNSPRPLPKLTAFTSELSEKSGSSSRSLLSASSTRSSTSTPTSAASNAPKFQCLECGKRVLPHSLCTDSFCNKLALH